MKLSIAMLRLIAAISKNFFLKERLLATEV